MARRTKGSPRIKLEITEADRATAKASNSYGCLIADALKRAGYLRPSVDMATTSLTDPVTGNRCTYLTPHSGQHLLLGLDQGWPIEGVVEVEYRRAVQITPVIRSRVRSNQRAERLAALEAKEQAGTLTPPDKAALTKMRRNPGAASRPTTTGRAEVKANGVVLGGQPRVKGPAHPNLLRGYNRIYGAKLADPGQAFTEAVEAAVREREASSSVS